MAYTKITFVVLLTVIICFQCIGQDNVEIRIKEIETECGKINNEIKRLNMIQSDVNGLSAEGGILKKYYDGKTLKKAVLTLFGETGQSTSEYYFMNGDVIFMKERIDMYTGPIDVSKGQTESTETNKYYFAREKLIQWIDNDDEKVSSDQYPEKESEILDDIKNIIDKNK